MATQTLGSRMRQLRQERAFTLLTLASAAGISVSYLNDIEHDRTVPTLGRLGDLAKALDVSVRELLTGVHPYDSPAGKP